ncbi:hypothetical protein GE061_004958 [Apolygus lucorum]|uniref:Uncharacterized protein n=1 Tax=Apolygus lucorum TaxID=248454 RepID=A0A8S9WYU1_APOLU|nr:hypothetical protein GE061_004958 [Apolygus lucorum]
MRGDEEVRKADDRSKEDAFSSKEDTFSSKDEDISRALLFKRKQSTPCNFRFFEDTDNESPLVKIKIPPAPPSENGSSYNEPSGGYNGGDRSGRDAGGIREQRPLPGEQFAIMTDAEREPLRLALRKASAPGEIRFFDDTDNESPSSPKSPKESTTIRIVPAAPPDSNYSKSTVSLAK